MDLNKFDDPVTMKFLCIEAWKGEDNTVRIVFLSFKKEEAGGRKESQRKGKCVVSLGCTVLSRTRNPAVCS